MAMLVPSEFDAATGTASREYISHADSWREAVMKCVCVDDDDPERKGIAAPAVNPLKHASREALMTGSPEGQCFVVMMLVAWGAYKESLSARRPHAD